MSWKNTHREDAFFDWSSAKAKIGFVKQMISPPSPLPGRLNISLAVLQNCLKLQLFGAQLSYKSYLATLHANTKAL